MTTDKNIFPCQMDAIVYILLLFSNYFPREFCKRMAPDLPFYYWTLNERFRADDDDDHDSFDAGPDIPDDQDPSSHPLRLHRLRINRREDASIICAGRAFLPARNQTSIRQRIHRPLAQLPDPRNRAS